MAIKGDLRDMSLTNIISINCNERNQARLIIKDKRREAAIFFQDGQVVHASLDSQTGEDVIYELLTWEEGEFELEQGVFPPIHSVTAGWSGMLLEGMRRIDESAAGWGVDWDRSEAEAVHDDIMGRMVKSLKRINGIEGVLICTGDGEVLSQETNDDYKNEADITASVLRQAEVIGSILKTGRLKQAVLTGETRRVVIVAHKQNYVVVSLAMRTAVESMMPVIQMILRRYS